MAASADSANVVCEQVKLLKPGKPLDCHARTMLWNVYCYFQLEAERTNSTSMIGDAIEKTALATGISVFTARGIVAKARGQLKEQKPLDFTFAPRKKRAIKEGPKIPGALYRSWRQAREASLSSAGALGDQDQATTSPRSPASRPEDDEEDVVVGTDNVDGETLEGTVTAENVGSGARLEAVQQLTIASSEHMSQESWKALQRALRADPCTQRTEQGFFGGRLQPAANDDASSRGRMQQQQQSRQARDRHLQHHVVTGSSTNLHQSDHPNSSHWGHFVLMSPES